MCPFYFSITLSETNFSKNVASCLLWRETLKENHTAPGANETHTGEKLYKLCSSKLILERHFTRQEFLESLRRETLQVL